MTAELLVNSFRQLKYDTSSVSAPSVSGENRWWWPSNPTIYGFCAIGRTECSQGTAATIFLASQTFFSFSTKFNSFLTWPHMHSRVQSSHWYRTISLTEVPQKHCREQQHTLALRLQSQLQFSKKPVKRARIRPAYPETRERGWDAFRMLNDLWINCLCSPASIKIQMFPLRHLSTLQLFNEHLQGFPGGTVIKNPPANAGDTKDTGLIPGEERFPRAGNGNPFQCSCLDYPMDRGT